MKNAFLVLSFALLAWVLVGCSRDMSATPTDKVGEPPAKDSTKKSSLTPPKPNELPK